LPGSTWRRRVNRRDDRAQHGGVAEIKLAHRGQQGERAFARRAAQIRDRLAERGKLRPIAPVELGEPRRLMAVPAPQLMARREVGTPGVERKRGLGDAARPQAVDQDAPPVVRRPLLVDALDAHARLRRARAPWPRRRRFSRSVHSPRSKDSAKRKRRSKRFDRVIA